MLSSERCSRGLPGQPGTGTEPSSPLVPACAVSSSPGDCAIVLALVHLHSWRPLPGAGRSPRSPAPGMLKDTLWSRSFSGAAAEWLLPSGGRAAGLRPLRLLRLDLSCLLEERTSWQASVLANAVRHGWQQSCSLHSSPLCPQCKAACLDPLLILHPRPCSTFTSNFLVLGY